MKKRLYDEYLRRLLEVNDESKTDDEHRQIEARFRGWLEGVEDAAGHRFNGDYYYIFSIHAPVKGATGLLGDTDKVGLFQSTRP